MEARRHSNSLAGYRSMSGIQTEPKRHTFTHFLDEISGWHVRNSNGAQQLTS